MLTVDADRDVVERQLGDGEPACPWCGGVLARWGKGQTAGAAAGQAGQAGRACVAGAALVSGRTQRRTVTLLDQTRPNSAVQRTSPDHVVKLGHHCDQIRSLR